MDCVLAEQAPWCVQTARVYVRAWSWGDHFATDACDQGGHLGMHDSALAVALVAGPVWCILKYIHCICTHVVGMVCYSLEWYPEVVDFSCVISWRDHYWNNTIKLSGTAESGPYDQIPYPTGRTGDHHQKSLVDAFVSSIAWSRNVA